MEYVQFSLYELPGLSLAETGTRNIDRLWLRGGLPLSFTARGHAASRRWRRDFVRTFLVAKGIRAVAAARMLDDL